MFFKSASVDVDADDVPMTQQAALARAKAAGDTVLKIVTDGSEPHVLCKTRHGRHLLRYFDLAPVSKAATPAKITDADLSPETRMKLAARYGGQTEEETDDMTTKVKTEGRLGELAKAYAAEFLADENDRKAAQLFEQRCREIQKRDECSATMALETAANECPEEFELWQSGGAVTAGG